MDRIELYKRLPQAVTEYLFDPQKEEPLRKALAKENFKEEVLIQIILLADDVVLKVLPMSELPAKIKEIAGIDDAKAAAISKELIGYRLLPLEAFIDGLDLEVTRLGIDRKAYAFTAVEKRKVSPEEFVRETLTSENLSLPDATLQSRLEFILTSYLRGVRTRPQTVAMMSRSDKVGGLGVSDELAGKMLDIIDARKATIAIDAPSKTPPVVKSAAVRPPAPIIKPPAPITPAPTPKPIAPPPVAKPIVPPPVVTPVPQKVVMSVEQAVEQLVASANVSFPAAELTARFKQIVQARFKDLRDALETKQQLSQSTDKGGLGLPVAEIERVSAAIEAVYRSLHGANLQKAQEEKKKFVEQKVVEQKAREQVAQKDSEDLAKRYAALTGKAPTTVATPPATARVSGAMPKSEELARSAQKIDATAKAVLRQAAPRPAPVMPVLSTMSVPPSNPGAKPQMADIKYTQKLVGPVEELRTMTLTDFHRLASDPDQAVLKIQDKIALLKQESYEKMVEGVKAWKDSAVNKMYVELSGEALRTGKPVTAVSAEWKAAGKETLTPEEVKAVVKLNTALRF